MIENIKLTVLPLPGKKPEGKKTTIYYGCGISSYGECFLAETENRICFTGFLKSAGREKQLEKLVSKLRRDWPMAEIIEDNRKAQSLVKRIFDKDSAAGDKTAIEIIVRGTEFQKKVWQALLEIPRGTLLTYSEAAAAAGYPRAVRAAANAVAANRAAYLIPCHRVIAKSGNIHKYAYGPEIKKAMIEKETTGN